MTKRDIIGRCLLLELLDKKRLSQADLASMTDISKSQINEYIKGVRSMSLHNAAIIAHALGCSIDNLNEWKLDKHRGR